MRGQTQPITTAQITALLGLPDSHRDTVASLICSDVRRGRIVKTEAMRVRNLPVNGYMLVCDVEQKTARAPSTLDSRRRDRAASIKARRALWDMLRADGRQLTLPEIALAAGVDKYASSWIVSEMVKVGQVKRTAIHGTHQHSKGPRWRYYVDSGCSEPKEPQTEKIAAVKGFDFRELMAVWPDPVSVPAGGAARVHKLEGGWA